uniref:Corticotropin-releasing factor domain-containing protein n=1 Tax=Crocodylus porosus TaxID=8502 RepID=A0A7M4FKZ0_CROPO
MAGSSEPGTAALFTCILLLGRTHAPADGQQVPIHHLPPHTPGFHLKKFHLILHQEPAFSPESDSTGRNPGTGQAAAVMKKSSPGSKVSLSLDVPLHILRVLLEEAKVKDMRAKAAANAELMARIGRRK